MKKYVIILLCSQLLVAMKKDNLAPFPDLQNKPQYKGGWFKVNEFESAPRDLNSFFEIYGPVKKPYDISSVCKTKLLKNLFKEARQISFLNDCSPGELRDQEIARILSSTEPINEIQGRILKVDLSGSTVNLYYYMIYNGRRAAENALINSKINNNISIMNHD